ncbi:MAG TPA: HypC/HybG/HupF family hydrogenase formation chaperone [Acidimicrobiales bacterium]|nr:HypC/HybG/HupF family hydrogenase formation chaperone [Acidimicrobiales bacterium]
MCVGIPARIVEIGPPASHTAVADVEGTRREINTMVIDAELAVGDWVLLHVGFAMATIDEDEALETLAFMREAGATGEVAG